MTDRIDQLSDRARWFLNNFDEIDLADICGSKEAAIARVRRAAEQWRLAAHEGDLSIAWGEAATAVLALLDNPQVTYADLGFDCPAITGHATPASQPPAPAHDTGPTVREAADADRRWFDGEKAGE
jgi:hypothetical protein